MAELHVNPTRMELKRLKTRLATARRGHKLLKDKCDELMKQFLELVRENRELRRKVENSLAESQKSFARAGAVMSPDALTEALMLPKTEGRLDVHTKNLMSVIVPQFDFSIGSAAGDSDSVSYGFAFTSGELDNAIAELSSILPDMLRLAEVEKACQMLAAEIEKTRRRVNALEYIMMPQLETGIKSIVMKLDENERGNTTRLMKVKDMIAAKAINERTAADTEAEAESQ